MNTISNSPSPVAQNAVIEDLGFNPADLSGKEIVAYLDKRIHGILVDIQASPFWAFLTSPDSDPATVVNVMKEIYLEIVMYQPDVIEATIGIIGQFPRYIPATLIEEMLHHQAEEFDHGEMALRDFLNLGGKEEFARNRPMSSSAFQVAAMWTYLRHKRDPFAYLGALYPFEGLTPIVTGMVKEILKQKGMPRNTLTFIEYHATADLEHTALVKEMIEKIADAYPESKVPICYGIEYFLSVYPLPVWNKAYERGIAAAS